MRLSDVARKIVPDLGAATEKARSPPPPPKLCLLLGMKKRLISRSWSAGFGELL